MELFSFLFLVYLGRVHLKCDETWTWHYTPVKHSTQRLLNFNINSLRDQAKKNGEQMNEEKNQKTRPGCQFKYTSWNTGCPQRNVYTKPCNPLTRIFLDYSRVSSQVLISLYFIKIGQAGQELWPFWSRAVGGCCSKWLYQFLLSHLEGLEERFDPVAAKRS